jgi:adenylate cyclase
MFPERFEAESVGRDLARDTAFALAVAAVLQVMMMIRDVIGGRVLRNIVTGRYHQPLSEERVFMFLDVSRSTTMAVELGDVATYSLLSRFFFDVAQETVEFGGETHRYIGDEVVVTWPLDVGTQGGRCFRCYFAIRDRIASKAEFYQRRFGRVPDFRVGLHGGSVVAGECGDDKREIVYFGDTINTAARIQEACKSYEQPMLVSGDLLERMQLDDEYKIADIGKVQLRGREHETELFTVSRQQDEHDVAR